jgi:hypothetical protein
MNIKIIAAALAVAAAIIFGMALPSQAETKSEIYKNWQGLAIKGFDPVAFHNAGKPVEGSSKYELKWKDVKWRFASAELTLTLRKFLIVGWAVPTKYR